MIKRSSLFVALPALLLLLHPAAALSDPITLKHGSGKTTYKIVDSSLQPDESEAGDAFGSALAISKDSQYLAVGAESSVYLYGVSSTKSWTGLTDPIVPDTGGEGSSFGQAIALAAYAKVIAVGGPTFGAESSTNEGAVWLFQYNALAKSYTEIAGPIAPIDQQDAFAGSAVDISADGKVLAVGAYGANGNNGAVYIIKYDYYVQDYVIDQIIDGVNGEQFGAAVQFSYDSKTLVVGAPAYENNTGAVYVYKYDYVDQEYYLYSGPLSNDATDTFFGSAVAVSKDAKTIAVGGDGFNGGEGAVWIYTYSHVNVDYILWEGPIQPANFTGPIGFGSTLDFSAVGTLVVGAPGYGDNDANLGALYVLGLSSSKTWLEVDGPLAPSDLNDSYYGSAVVISFDGKTLFAGAPGYDNDAGIVWVYQKKSY